MIQIEYIDSASGDRLGLVKKEGIVETLIPRFNSETFGDEHHKVFINKHFSDVPGQLLWEVTGLACDGNNVTVRLMPERDAATSFGLFAEKQNIKKVNAVVRKHQVIDVDFGHRSDLYSGEKRSPNDVFAGAILPGELHKKRPCIVLGTSSKWRTIQVIPLSTKDPAGDKRCVSIPSSTFNNAAHHYRKKKSYALLDNIQTVSWMRAYPLRGADNRFMRNDKRVYISPHTRQHLQALLAAEHLSSQQKELQQAQRQIEKLSAERSRIVAANSRMKTELSVLKASDAATEAVLRKVATQLFDISDETTTESMIQDLEGVLG